MQRKVSWYFPFILCMARTGMRIGEATAIQWHEKLLEITYSFPDRTGRSEFTVRVPVPPGESARASAIAAELKGTRQ
jgi:hypothetical protein